MSNRRAMLFFIVGILLLGGLLLWLDLRSRRVVPDARADVLCALSPAHVNACFVRSAGRDEVELARGEDGLWRIVQPFSVAADASAVLILPVPRHTARARSRCRHCAQISIMDLPRPIPHMVRSVLKCGSTKARSFPQRIPIRLRLD